MRNPFPILVYMAGIIVSAVLIAGQHPGPENPPNLSLPVLTMIAAASLASCFKIAAQWEKALIFRAGRYLGTKGPGSFLIIPFADQVRLIDTRIQTIEIPVQQAITKDNVPVSIDGVIFLRVANPQQAVIQVQNYLHAIRQYSQTALRDVIGGLTLDEILADREIIGHKIQKMVEVETDGWGLEVAAIRIQDIVLPEDLKRVMARQASAEREKRANITKSEGDREAAENLAVAAETMARAPGALQLRTLQSLDSLGSSQANTVVMAVPVELMNTLGAITEVARGFTPVKTAKKVEDTSVDRQALSQPKTPALEEKTEKQVEQKSS